MTILAALSCSGLAQNSKKKPKDDPDAIGNRNVGKGVNLYSLEKEIAMGRELAQQVERQAKVITDPVVAEYVNRVGQNLVRNSDAKVPFTIKVLDSDEVNAFALPGGFFFINSGLILKADNEAELARCHGPRNCPCGRPAQHAKRHERKHRADRHACRGHRHPLWLDRLRRPARRGISHTHRLSGLFASQ
jgi:predicted Zn-dependent protease